MSGARRRRILAIEGDPEIRHLLSTVLTDAGFEVLVAETAAAAAEELAGGSPDLVLLDLILPDADGRALLSRIREDPATAALPVLVVSSRTGEAVRHECYTIGADSYFERPFDPDTLVADVDVYLKRAEQRERAALKDQLTGLLNLPGLRAAYEECAGSRGLLMIELDGFSDISGKWGWATAERVVYEVGKAIERSVPEGVRSVRIGGGEFALLVPGAVEGAAAGIAEHTLGVIQSLPIEDPERETFRLTASLGVTTVGEEAAFDEAVAAARTRLFLAREWGGNRILAEDLPGARSGNRIIVADDDDIAATLLLHRLEKDGLDVTRYDNGLDAFNAVIEELPDLVILDVKMPGMDGFEVVERLRRTPSCAEIPVILLTSMGSEADVVRGFELGADDYVLKPFSPIELLARVRRLLSRGRPTSAV